MIHAGEARYPNLFSPESFAIWVDPSVAAMKRVKIVEAGETVDPDLDDTAKRVSDKYFIFECHLDSMFPDASIGYESVGLRAIDPYLMTPEGMKISPVQRIPASGAEEEQVEALKRFRRTTILVFPKQDILVHQPTIDASAPGVRLVLEGFNSSFYFEWPAAPGSSTGGWSPSDSEAIQAVKMGFKDLFTELRALSHMFD